MVEHPLQLLLVGLVLLQLALMITTLSSTATSLTTIGAILDAAGTTFRVWAPFASSVAVVGDFNRWSDAANPLTRETNGYWFTKVPNAQVGQKYQYSITNGSQTYRRNDPRAKQVVNSSGDSVIHSADFAWETTGRAASYKIPNWNEMVIYEMHIGTFNDAPGGEPGNFASAIARLDYLQDLGINVIEIMPTAEFAGDFSWGYNPAYPYAIESIYGGPQSLKQFVQASHQRGIAVILDVVYNHFGPSDLDLWQFDGWSQNGKGGIYFYNDWRSTTPWGDTRPDYGREEVRQYIHDNVLMWLEEYQIDGLRWDATAYIHNVYGRNNDPSTDIAEGWNLMQSINNEIDTKYPNKISIAEDLRNKDWITKSTGAGGAGFDAQWADSFFVPVRAAIIPPDDSTRNMDAIRDAIYHRFNGNAFERVIYTESHDEVANGKARIPYSIWPERPDSWFSKKRSTLGAALVFTAPGIPMLFQGQEILEDEWFRDDDPVDWEKLNRFQGIHDLYRDLIRLRRNRANTTRGLLGQSVNVYHVNNSNKLLGFHRWDNGGPGDDVVIVANLANQSYDSYNIGFPREGLWKVRFNSDWQGYSSDFGNHFSYDTTANRFPKDGLSYSGNIGIGPYSVILLSQDS